MSDDPNPYTAQQFSQPTPAGAQKSSAPKILGIINIVFGVIGMIGLALSVVGLFIMATMDMPGGQANPVVDLMENNSTYQIFTYATIFLGAIFSVVLLIAGFGLLNYRKFGRTFSIAYGAYAIVSAIVGVVVNMVFIAIPMFSAVDDPVAQTGAVVNTASTLGGGCFGVIYPAILLFFMFKPYVVESLE